MENKKFNRKPKKVFNGIKENKQDEIVYVTKSSRPASMADWQLLLRAMADCYDAREDKDYRKMVDIRYNELKNKQKNIDKN